MVIAYPCKIKQKSFKFRPVYNLKNHSTIQKMAVFQTKGFGLGRHVIIFLSSFCDMNFTFFLCLSSNHHRMYLCISELYYFLTSKSQIVLGSM